MKKIIIDCDPGLDDFLALALAFNENKLDILAITTVAGNQIVEKCTNNALKTISLFDKKIKLYEGARFPIYRNQIIASHIHGESGMGTTKLPETNLNKEGMPAYEYLIDITKKYQDINILAIGPLTNIALAIINDRDFASRVGSLTIMGAAHFNGNVTAAAEFNFYADPHAARIVYESGIDIITVPLDATMSKGINKSDIEFIFENKSSKINNILKNVLNDICNTGEGFGFEEGFIHDAVAFLSLINKDFLKTKYLRLDIETKSSISLGKSVLDIDFVSGKKENTHFAFSYDKDFLLEKLINLVNRYSI